MTRLLRHFQVLFDTLGRMWKTPLPTLMTMIMLGIAMALPLSLHTVVNSMAEVPEFEQWRDLPRISLFLNADPPPDSPDSDAQAIEFGRQLLKIPVINDIQYISPRDALAEFQRVSGFGEALDNLPENPLPPLLVVFPDAAQGVAKIAQLTARLAALEEVDSASFDQQWLQRLAAILALFERGVAVLGLLMALGVALIISNTVRLGVASRNDEIEIIDQVGGARAFIRRPFLYFGALQGLFGGLFACVIGNAGLYLLRQPAATLAALYESGFQIEWIGLPAAAWVALSAACLGWLAARVTVDWRLRKFHSA